MPGVSAKLEMTYTLRPDGQLIVNQKLITDPNAKDKQTLALLEALIDWQKEDKLFENQQLLRTPIVRNGRKATVGYQPDVWKDWE